MVLVCRLQHPRAAVRHAGIYRAQVTLANSCQRQLLYTAIDDAMRFYEQKYPEADETVMVQVKQIQEMGAYVKLVSGSDCLSLSKADPCSLSTTASRA